MSRRSLLAAAFAGASGLALGSCARGTQSRPTPGDVVTFFNDVTPWAPGYAKASDQLHELVGYRLAPRAVPDVSSYQQVIRMSAQTDSTPDLFKWWNGFRLQDVARQGILLDLTEAWDEAAERGWSDDRVLRTSFTHAGRQYGMPLYKSYYVVFYSKPVFDRLGVGVPTTWQEFLDVVGAARARKVTPIAAPGATTYEALIWFQQLVNGLDHQYYLDVTAGRASYTDTTCREAMDLWVDLYERGAFSAPDIESTDVPGQFTQGTTAMQLHGTWNTGNFLLAGVEDEDLGAFLLPPPPGGDDSVIVESSALCVASKAHKRAEALEVAKAWLHPSVQRAWTGFLKDASADPEVVPDVGVLRDVTRAVGQRTPSQATRYWEASPPVLIEGNVLDLSAFVIEPTRANAARTLAKMQARADREWQVWRQ